MNSSPTGMAALLPEGSVVADPLNVSFIRANGDWKVRRAFLNRTFSAGRHQFLDFGVAVGKGETAGSVMGGAGKITPAGIFHWVSRGAKYEETVVNAVRMFVQEDVCVRRISEV